MKRITENKQESEIGKCFHNVATSIQCRDISSKDFSNVVTLSLELRHQFFNVATSHLQSSDTKSNILSVSQHQRL